MRPIELAAAHCHEKGIVFEDFFVKYLANPNGFLVSNPLCFALGRPAEMEDGAHGWMVDLAAGSLQTLVAQLPFNLPFIAFHRNFGEKLRVYPLERFKRLVNL